MFRTPREFWSRIASSLLLNNSPPQSFLLNNSSPYVPIYRYIYATSKHQIPHQISPSDPNHPTKMPPKKATAAKAAPAKAAPAKASATKRKASGTSQGEPEAKKAKTAKPAATKAAPKKPAAVSEPKQTRRARLTVLSDQGQGSQTCGRSQENCSS